MKLVATQPANGDKPAGSAQSSDFRHKRSFKEEHFALLYLACDIYAILAAVALAHWVRYVLALGMADEQLPGELFTRAEIALPVCFVLLFKYFGLYRPRQIWRIPELFFSVCAASLLGMMAFLAFAYLARQYYHRLFLAYVGVFVVLLVTVLRIVVIKLQRWLQKRGRGLVEKRIAIMGSSTLVRTLETQIRRHPELGFVIVNPFSGGEGGALSSAEHAAKDHLLAMRQAAKMVRSNALDQVVFDDSMLGQDELWNLLTLFHSHGLELKRFLDFVLAGTLVVLFAPLLILLSIAVKLDSPGPVFFSRRILGYRGRAFNAYKIRTMVSNAHEILQNNPDLLEQYKRNLKLDVDPRITRLGAFLRKYSLDELPQLFNIVRGDMSLIGPRMLGNLELERYGECQEKVLSVRPGLTGLWQVSGRHTVSFNRRMELDLEYIDNWCLSLDVKILFKTFSAVVRATGAQ